MNDQNTSVPISFWIISVLALIWNGLGIMNFIGQTFMSEEDLAALPQEQQHLYENVPMWITVIFAIAVTTATLGCIGLLMRKAWAVPLFLVSMITVLVQMLHGLILTDMIQVVGAPALVATILVIAVAIFLYWYSKQCRAKGWLT